MATIKTGELVEE